MNNWQNKIDELKKKECNILTNNIDLSKKDDRYPSLDIRGQERLKFEKGFFKEDVEEFIMEIIELHEQELKSFAEEILKYVSPRQRELKALIIKLLSERLGRQIQ
jgi:hypothetical protein